ncbi:MAG: hypothetical protein P1P81_04440 [Desulfobulbales bacterium]|nr:hypothetical protein [Desulfobulbales bacterium]
MTAPAAIFDSAAEAIFTAAADPGAGFFIPASGNPVACHVNIEQDVILEGDQGQVYRAGFVLEYLLSKTGREVVVGEAFTIGSTTWTVKQLIANDGRFARAIVK